MKGHKPKKRPIDEGFSRKQEFEYSADAKSLEEMLRQGFEQVLPMIIKEFNEQKSGVVQPRPFRAYVDAHMSNLYKISIEINGTPPTIEEVAALLASRAENAHNN